MWGTTRGDETTTRTGHASIHDMNRRFDRVDERFDAFGLHLTAFERTSHTQPDA